ncbi:MAG TPA: hypothetical protein DEP84_18490 [Chloroflexi bacterium]|nr:hypothetical protein [Chloroflexota bacterium]
MSAVKMTAGRTIAEALLAEGVRHLFGITGDGNLEFVNAIYDSDLRFVLARHEQGAAYMAYGYARTRKGLGACLSMYGPGATNLLSGVAAAHKGLTPLIALTGKHALALQPRGGHQQLDEVSIFRPVTKWSVMVTQAEQVPEIMRKACRIALSEPMGPVHISLPVDLVETKIEARAWRPEQYRAQREARIDAEAVRVTAQTLSDARAPVIIAGREVLWSNATPHLIRLAERLGLPVTTTGGAIDAFPNVHPLGLGPFGAWAGWDPANEVVKNADWLLAVGVRFDFDLGSVRAPYGIIPRQARMIQVNRLPDTIGAIYPVELGMAGSITGFLEDLLAEADRLDLPQRNPNLAALKAAWAAKRAARADSDARPIKPEYAITVIRDAMAEDSVFLADVGNVMSRTRSYYDTARPDSFSFVEAFGALGSVFPTALGVQVAAPERQVVCLCGDGAFPMNLAELETSVRERLPVKVFICNDSGFGSVWTRQKRAYAGRFLGVELLGPNFANVAREFGAFGERVDDPHELAGAVRRALAYSGPAVVDILTARE